MTGPEMMMNAAIKALGLNPEQVKSDLDVARQIIVSLDGRLKAIEAQNAEILQHLKGQDHGRDGKPEFQSAGANGAGTGPGSANAASQ